VHENPHAFLGSALKRLAKFGTIWINTSNFIFSSGGAVGTHRKNRHTTRPGARAICFALAIAALIACTKSPEPAAGAITELAGGASLDRAGKTMAVEPAMLVILHDRLTTAADGRLTVTLADQSQLQIAASSTIILDNAVMSGKGSDHISLALGTLRSIVKPISNTGDYEVRTANLVAGVRGTDFAVSYQPGSSTTTSGQSVVEVTEGKVAVNNPALPNVQPVLIQAGQRTTVSGDEAPAPPRPITMAAASPAPVSAASPNAGAPTAAAGTVSVTDCQEIDKPGTYLLTKNVETGRTCFPISTSTVTLDLGGHSIGGNGSYPGISANPPSGNVLLTDIVIKNGAVENFSDGIYVPAAKRVTIEGVTVRMNGDHGLLLGMFGTVKNCTVEKNVGIGVYADGFFATLTGNTVTGNDIGIRANCPATISNNKVIDNKSANLRLNDESKCTLSGNTAPPIEKK
jgi:hypothetical protein